MLHAAALTSAGRCRNVNEDSFTLLDLATGRSAPEDGGLVSLRSQGAILGVYDGHGHIPPFRTASHAAALIVAERLSTVPAGATGGELSRRLHEALQVAHREIFAMNSANHCGVGTTATVAAISSRDVSIAHVGDSRAYLFAGGELRQITQDDTLLNELIAAGKLTPEEIESFPHKNVLLRVLGMTGESGEVEVPVTSLALQAGDVLLLCSDGVSGVVGDPAMAAILGAHRDPAEACRSLIEAAEEAGGFDNETAVVARFEELPAELHER